MAVGRMTGDPVGMHRVLEPPGALPQAAERLASPVWQAWPDHDDLVFPTQIGTPTDPRKRYGRSLALPSGPDSLA